jgi:cytochrome P450
MSLLQWLRPRPRASFGSVDLAAPPAALDPFAVYEGLRRAGPVHYLPKHDFWLVLSYAAVKRALERPDEFSNSPYASIDAVLLAADPPRHTAVRKLVAPLFSAETTMRVEAAAAAEAAARLAPQFDAVAGFSLAVSRAAAASLLGFDGPAAAELALAADSATAEAEPVEALVDAVTRFADRSSLFRDLAAEGSDLLPEAEVRSLIRLLWLAATTTTERVITRSILCLLRQPELHSALLSDRSLVGRYVEEVMRLYPPELILPRRAARATSLSGCRIPAGADVRLCVAAANRDPAAWPEPGELSLQRAPKHHLTFGAGAHRCLGAGLARRVAPTALAALLDRPGTLRAAEPLDRLDWFASITALAPIRLPVAID